MIIYPEVSYCTWLTKIRLAGNPTGYKATGSLPLLSARLTVTFPAKEHDCPITSSKLYCLVTEAHRYHQPAWGCCCALPWKHRSIVLCRIHFDRLSESPVQQTGRCTERIMIAACLQQRMLIQETHQKMRPKRDTGMRYTPCLKKTVQTCFCQNFVKFISILIIFGRKMAKRLKLYEMHSFSTSSNSRHHTTVLNADVPKCYRTQKVDICNKLSNDVVHNKLCLLYTSPSPRD